MLADSYDVIIVGGSFAGLSAALCLGRAHRKVLVIDSGFPCNRPAINAHNLLSRDGANLSELISEAKSQILAYPTITFESDEATELKGENKAFQVLTKSGKSFNTKKVIFSTGVKDQPSLTKIIGLEECWGITALHCPFCHGYEVSNEPLAVLGNGVGGYKYVSMVSQWSKNLVLLTNGASELTQEQEEKLSSNGIKVIQTPVTEVIHNDGKLNNVAFNDGSLLPCTAIFAHVPFTQHCGIPKEFGCEFTPEGYIKVSAHGLSSIPGIYAAGDNTTAFRFLSIAMAAGATVGALLSVELTNDIF